MSRPYKPGDTFTHQMLEFIAVDDSNSDAKAHECDGCVGNLHRSVCDMLPVHCNSDEIIWKASNESAKTLHAILKLEGAI